MDRYTQVLRRDAVHFAQQAQHACLSTHAGEICSLWLAGGEGNYSNHPCRPKKNLLIVTENRCELSLSFTFGVIYLSAYQPVLSSAHFLGCYFCSGRLFHSYPRAIRHELYWIVLMKPSDYHVQLLLPIVSCQSALEGLSLDISLLIPLHGVF